MDASDFTPNALGRVRGTLEGYQAFFPNALPRRIDYDARTVRLLTDATAALHRLAGASRLLPTPEILMGPYVRIEAVLSSRIEGTQTSLSDLLLFEADDYRDGDLEGDLREVVNHTRALDNAMDGLARLPLSLRLLRETHAVLMDGVRGGHLTPGEFRTSQNWIGPSTSTLSTARFVPPPVDAMKDALRDLEAFLHEHELPNLITLAMAHYQFETIHPFLDGNGRIGRLLVPLALVDRGVLERPMLYLSAFFEQHRSTYYDLLLSTSATGDLTPWLNFFLEGVAVQSRDAEERTVRLVDLQAALREQLLVASATTTTLRLAESLLDRPYVTVRGAATQFDVTFPTAQKAIDTLVEMDVLEEITGQQRNRIYLSRRVMEVVYGDPARTADA